MNPSRTPVSDEDAGDETHTQKTPGTTMDLIDKARAFATAAHAAVDQRRKYVALPYIRHPEDVALLTEAAGGDEAMIAAAYTHDTIEDTGRSREEVAAATTPDVAQLTHELSDQSTPSDGNRAVRKAIDREHAAAGSARAKTIKIADLIVNAISIFTHDRDFAHVFLREKELLLERMPEADGTLRAIAYHMVRDMSARLHKSVPLESELSDLEPTRTRPIIKALLAWRERELGLRTGPTGIGSSVEQVDLRAAGEILRLVQALDPTEDGRRRPVPTETEVTTSD